MKKFKIAALLLAVAACAGPSYKLNLKPYQLDSKDFQLGSGLRILFQEDHTAPVVFVTNLVDHGSTSDQVGKEGIAHLIEHLCFRAKHHNGQTVWDEIQGVGAINFNAFTADDKTQYLTEAPKEALGALLDIEAARMIDPTEGVGDDVLKIEREVVRNELRFRVENARAGNKQFEIIKEMLFPEGNVYHRTGIGTHDSLSAITMKDVHEFTANYYRPEDMTIVVSGDFDANQAKDLIVKHFPAKALAGDHKPRTEARIDPTKPAPPPPPPADQKYHYTKGPVTNPTVFLAWSLPGGHRENEELMQVTSAVMGFAVGSLLGGDPEDVKKDKVEGLGCFVLPNKDGSIAGCEIELTEGQKPEEIAKKAIDGIWETWDLDLDQIFRAYFSRAKAQRLAALFRSSASLERAIDLADYLHYNNRADYFAESFRRINKINAFDSRELAHKYLTRERVVVLITQPFGADETADTGSVARDSSSSWAGSTQENAAQSKVGFDKLTPEQIAKIVVLPRQEDFRELTLSNGLRVVMKRHGSAPFVQVALLTGGGSAQAAPWGFPDLDRRASDSPDPLQIAGSWFGGGWPDGDMVGIEGSAGNLPAAVDMLYKRVTTTRSEWTRRSFDDEVKRFERRLTTEEKRPDVWGERALLKTLLPGHPLAKSWDKETLKEVQKVDSGDFKSWIAKTNAPKNSTLFVVGDISLDEAEKTVRATWSKWREKDPGEAMKPLPPMPPSQSMRQIALVDRSDATQSDITLACPLAPVTDENRAAAAVISDLLQKDLWAAVRERAGASYGINAFPIHYNGGVSYLEISSKVQNDKSKLAVQAMMDAIKAVAEGKVKPEVLNESKWNAAQGAYIAYDSTDRMLNTLVRLTRDGRSLKSIQEYPQRLGAVTAQDIKAMLAPCTGHEIIAIVGADKSIHSSLASLGIPINMVDWKHGKPEVTSEMTDVQPVGTATPAPVATAAPVATPAPKATPKKTK